MLDFVFQNFTKDKSFKRDFFARVIGIGIEELSLKEKGVEISLNLVEETKIKNLNQKYRNKDKVTDVLSFPMGNKPIIHNSKFIIHDLGDIFICLPFAKNQAKGENISIDKELARLTVHGFLHLAGYDHEKSKNDSKKMLDLENKILRKIKL